MAEFAVLQLTNGTTTIDFLSEHETGFFLSGWEPGLSNLTGGGTWTNSPVSEGAELIVGVDDNVVETFTVDIVAFTADEMALMLQSFYKLARLGQKYTLQQWRETTVYLVVRADCESNLRYARVLSFIVPTETYFMGSPEVIESGGKMVIEDFSIQLVREPFWLATSPTAGTASPISNWQTYSGHVYGPVDSSESVVYTTDNRVYVANKQHIINITHVFYNGAGANLLFGGVPHNLIDFTLGNSTYFGVSVGATHAGPFNSLVFDTDSSNFLGNGQWEYWNGGWVVLPAISDQTVDLGRTFGNVGVISVWWEMPTDWAATVINGVNALWVRHYCTVNSAPPGHVVQQQNRAVYSVTWAFVETDGLIPGGDAPAKLQMKLYGQIYGQSMTNNKNMRVILGMRTKSRGLNFTPYLPATNSSDQLPSGMSCSSEGGAPVTFPAVNYEYTGHYANVAHAAAGASTIGPRWNFNYLLGDEYFGKYHAFVRAYTPDGTPSRAFVRLEIRFNSLGSAQDAIMWSSGDVRFVSGDEHEILDFGLITFPGTNLLRTDDPTPYETQLLCLAGTDNPAGDNIRIYDVILIPVDEYVADTYYKDSQYGFRLRHVHQLILDSYGSPKHSLRSILTYYTSTVVPWQVVGSTMVLEPKENQRIWYFMMGWNNTTDTWYAGPEGGLSIQLWSQERYTTLRGAD